MPALLIPALNPSDLTGRAGNNTWLLDGAEPALVDAGVGVPAHVDAIAAALGGRALRRVLVTHGHSDHAAGVPALRARWPALEAWKWPGPGESGWRALAEGERIRAGDAALTIIHTPGHALDHVCFWDAASRDLYGGDMVVLGSTVMIPGDRGGGLRAYLASLERLAALAPARILPGHGPIIGDPAALIAEYLDHRRLRDTQVAACLAEGLTDPDAIVGRMYPDLPAPLRFAAVATIESHIRKLREDGL
jgi:glyoxylase-like metal-dependent hydrolase (beta-lactamase superfamily II)